MTSRSFFALALLMTLAPRLASAEVPVERRVRIKNQNSGLCLTARPDGSLTQDYCSTNEHGPDVFKILATADPGEYRLVFQNDFADDRRCLDVWGWYQNDGAEVAIAACGADQPNQTFKIIRDPGTQNYVLVAKHSGKCVDIYGWSHSAGAEVKQYACHFGANQEFSFDPVSAGGTGDSGANVAIERDQRPAKDLAQPGRETPRPDLARRDVNGLSTRSIH